jgi:hypothetical protein
MSNIDHIIINNFYTIIKYKRQKRKGAPWFFYYFNQISFLHFHSIKRVRKRKIIIVKFIKIKKEDFNKKLKIIKISISKIIKMTIIKKNCKENLL